MQVEFVAEAAVEDRSAQPAPSIWSGRLPHDLSSMSCLLVRRSNDTERLQQRQSVGAIHDSSTSDNGRVGMDTSAMGFSISVVERQKQLAGGATVVE